MTITSSPQPHIVSTGPVIILGQPTVDEINARILARMEREQRNNPRLPMWAALWLACYEVKAELGLVEAGRHQSDGVADELEARRQERDYSHSDNAHCDYTWSVD